MVGVMLFGIGIWTMRYVVEFDKNSRAKRQSGVQVTIILAAWVVFVMTTPNKINQPLRKEESVSHIANPNPHPKK